MQIKHCYSGKKSIKTIIFSIPLALITVIAFGQNNNPNWKLVTKHAKWQPRDSQGEAVFNDQLWILGGWFNSYEAPPRDVWSSTNGKDWKLVNDRAPWTHSDLAMTVVFQNKMWIMGGWYNGRLPNHSASNSIWSSKDGRRWKLVSKDAGWSPRLGSAVVVFKGKIWLMGGTENYYFGDRKSLKNDVWYSSDGKNWHLATNHANWPPRAYLQATVLNGKIYVFGGGNYVPEYFALNDVWSSQDGIHWTKVCDAAPWHARLWFSSVVYRDRIWIMGGWSNYPFKDWSDVWYSKDGKEWKKYPSKIVWKARHALSAFVFKDKIWIAGGNTNSPLVNDVWSLCLPKGW